MVIRQDFSNNPYVQSLVNGLIKCGHEVVCGVDLFWSSFSEYQLIYFQWPEAIFEWKRSQIDIEKLSHHFESIKKAGVKTVITCHNLHPHNYDIKTTDLYNLVYSKVDGFHHLGKNSYKVMKDKYPSQYHFIAPHHIADNLWGGLSSLEAKRKLHISQGNIVISSFGAFRNNEERLLFIDMARDVTNRHISFLAPRILMERLYGEQSIKRTIKQIYISLLYKIIGIKYSGFLTEEELKIWLCASDIVFIQRKDVLNSGNLPLAFASEKVVAGPNIGNVGEVLKETGNFVFDPFDRSSVKRAVQDAINEVKMRKRLGFRNYQFAKENWTVSRVCEIIDKELLRIV